MRVYLQFENHQLCVKVEVERADERSRARNRACAALLGLPVPAPLSVVRPDRLGHGQWMTIGYVNGLPFGEQQRFAELAPSILAVEALVAALGERLREA